MTVPDDFEPLSLEPLSEEEDRRPRVVTLAESERLPVLRAAASRLGRAGFAAPPRIVFAAAMREVPTLLNAVRSIAEIQVALDAPRSTSLPRSLGTLWLGEDLAVGFMALPLDEAFSPLWALVLPGSSAVVRLSEPSDPSAGARISAFCESSDVPLIDAKALVTPLDVGSPSSIAALICAVIVAAAQPS
jgi:hypothetical protein